jgi:hypothetical protein
MQPFTGGACLVLLAVLLAAAPAGALEPSVKELPLPVGKNLGLVFSADSRTLAVVVREPAPTGKGYQSQVILIDTARGVERRRFALPQARGGGHMVLSADGQTLAVLGVKEATVLYDCRSGKRLRELEASELVREAVFSPDGKRLVALALGTLASRDGTSRLVVWDVASGKRLLQLGAGEIRAFALARDGVHVLAEHYRHAGKDEAGRPQVPFNVTARVHRLDSGADLGQAGDATVWSGDALSYYPGQKLYEVGAAGQGYYHGGPLGGDRFYWTPWCGRVGFAAGGQPVVFPDYRPTSPVLRGAGRLFTLVDPVSKKPLHEAGAFGSQTAQAVVLAADGTTLATAEFGGKTAKGKSRLRIWDLKELAGPLRGSAELNKERLQALWLALAGADVQAAHAAMRTLAANQAGSVALLQERLRPAAGNRPLADAVRRCLNDLDSQQFQVREAAGRKLEQLGVAARPFLVKALAARPALEVERRLQGLVQKLTGPISAEELAGLRAVDVLAQINTEAARELLRRLAAGGEGASLTEAAAEALARVKGGR